MRVREEADFYKSGQEAGEEFMKTPYWKSWRGGKRLLHNPDAIAATKHYTHVVLTHRLGDHFTFMTFDGKGPKRDQYLKTNAYKIRQHLDKYEYSLKLPDSVWISSQDLIEPYYEIANKKLHGVLKKIKDDSPIKTIQPLTHEYDVSDWVNKAGKAFHTGLLDKLWEPFT